MKTKIILIGVMFLASCGTNRISDGGATISVVNTTPNHCKYLNDVSGHDNNILYGEFVPNKTLEKNAINNLKDKAYEMGADTITTPVGGAKGGVVDLVKWRAIYHSKAYKCKK